MADLGKILILPKDSYSASTTYEQLDIVRYSNKSWMCKKTCKGVTPVEGEYWMLIVRDGTNGTNGTNGKDGVSLTATSSKAGKVTTVTIKNASTGATVNTFTVNDGVDGTGGGGDMSKATYDTNNNGIVDLAEGVSNGTNTLTYANLANKANKSTTLSGYGITDAYTKTQTDTALNNKLAKPSGGNVGDVLTKQSDGSYAPQKPSGGISPDDILNDWSEIKTSTSTDNKVTSGFAVQNFANRYTERVVFTIPYDAENPVNTKGIWQDTDPSEWTIDTDHFLILPEFYEADDEEIEFTFLFDTSCNQPIYLGGYQWVSQTNIIKEGSPCGGLCVKLANYPDTDVRIAVDVTHLRKNAQEV